MFLPFNEWVALSKARMPTISPYFPIAKRELGPVAYLPWVQTRLYPQGSKPKGATGQSDEQKCQKLFA